MTPSDHVMESTVVCGAVTLTLFVLAKFLWKCYISATATDQASALSRLPLPPGDYGWPLIGETIAWATQGIDFNAMRRKKYGNIFKTHLLGQAMVRVTGAENIRQILQSEHENVTTVWPKSMRGILGPHPITNLTGKEHRQIRKLVMKGFTHSALNSYISNARSTITRKVHSWKKNGVQKLYDEIRQMTFEVSAKALVGLTFKTPQDMHEIFRHFHEMVSNVVSFPYNLPFSGYRKSLRSKQVIHEILEGHLMRKMDHLISNGNGNSDVIDDDVMQLMLEADMEERRRFDTSDSDSESDKASNNSTLKSAKSSFTMQHLKEQAVELLFAGYSTTASAISSVIIQLAKHPEVKERLEKELEENGIIDVDDSKYRSQIDLTKIQHLAYLECVVKETLRSLPPILGGFRKALKTFQVGDYRIPKGWTIVYNIRDTHEFEFQNEAFDPDRFSRANWGDNQANRFRWIPFGGGPRVCIGKDFARLQIKLTVIELLRAFRGWSFESGTEPPMTTLPTLHPTNGLPVIFTPR